MTEIKNVQNAQTSNDGRSPAATKKFLEQKKEQEIGEAKKWVEAKRISNDLPKKSFCTIS